jgi:CHASE3 domain sensor protein
VSAETHQRAYIITGAEEYLPPYREAIDTVDNHIRRIGGLTRHNTTQQDRVAYLAAQVGRRSDEMNEAIVTRRTKGLAYAKSLVTVNQQTGTMNAIEDVTGQLREEEHHVLARHQAESDAWAFTTGSLAAVFFLLTAVLFTFCGVVMKMALASHAQAERVLQAFPSASTSAPAAG